MDTRTGEPSSVDWRGEKEIYRVSLEKVHVEVVKPLQLFFRGSPSHQQREQDASSGDDFNGQNFTGVAPLVVEKRARESQHRTRVLKL